MARYKAIKEGWDGRKIIKEGEIFSFDGPKGSWMVEVDGAGNVKEGEKYAGPAREVRAGTTAAKGATREDLRKQLTAAGVKFKATLGAVELAELLRKHQEKVAESKPADTVEIDGAGGGTGNQDVI